MQKISIQFEKIECIEIQRIMVLEIDHLNYFKDCSITNESTYEEKIIQQKDKIVDWIRTTMACIFYCCTSFDFIKFQNVLIRICIIILKNDV